MHKLDALEMLKAGEMFFSNHPRRDCFHQIDMLCCCFTFPVLDEIYPSFKPGHNSATPHSLGAKTQAAHMRLSFAKPETETHVAILSFLTSLRICVVLKFSSASEA